MGTLGAALRSPQNFSRTLEALLLGHSQHEIRPRHNFWMQEDCLLSSELWTQHFNLALGRKNGQYLHAPISALVISVEVDGEIPSVGPNPLPVTEGTLANWLQVPARTSLIYLSCLPPACCMRFLFLRVSAASLPTLPRGRRL